MEMNKTTEVKVEGYLEEWQKEFYILEHLFNWTHLREQNPMESYWKWKNAEGKNVAMRPHFFSDLNATYGMEEQLKRKGLEWEYMDKLERLVGWQSDGKTGYVFSVAHASAQQRAEACYQMLKEEEG